MQKPDFSKMTKKDSPKEEKPKSVTHDHDALFEMDGLDEVEAAWSEPVMPKTFSATQLGEQCEASQTVQMISAHNDFRPIDLAGSNQDDLKQNGNGKKKKKTRKVSSKKKHQRKSSISSVSSQSDRAASEQRASQPTAIPNATDINFFSDTEASAAALRYVLCSPASISCMHV